MKQQRIRLTFRYRVSRKTIWEAITDPDELEQWFFKVHNFNLERGCEFDFFEPGGYNKYYHVCRILDFKRRQFLRYSLTYPNFSRGVSIVTWKIRSAFKGTRVILIHSHLESYSDAGMDFHPDNFRHGWNQVLGKALKDFVEKDQASALTEGLIEDE